MNPFPLALAAVATVVFPASANFFPEDGRLVSAAQLAAEPEAFLKEAIRVDPLHRSAIWVPLPGHQENVDALTLGPVTSDSAAERLAEKCKGTAAFDHQTCTFDAAFISQSSKVAEENGFNVGIVRTREIDMFQSALPPAARCREA